MFSTFRFKIYIIDLYFREMSVVELSNISFSASLDNLAVAENCVEKVCSELNISEEVFPNILLACTEAVNNAIQHGAKRKASERVFMSISKNDKYLQIVVRDNGSGFDFTNLPDPTAPENLEKESGRGVFLMRSLADEVGFQNNGAEVVLRFLV